MWRARVALLCFPIVEWHHPDRVLRQFGFSQHIPDLCDTGQRLHNVDMRSGRGSKNWAEKHAIYFNLWQTRYEHVFTPPNHNVSLGTYMSWYRRITRRFIGPVAEPVPTVGFQPTAAIRELMGSGHERVYRIAEVNVQNTDVEQMQRAFAEIMELSRESIQVEHRFSHTEPAASEQPSRLRTPSTNLPQQYDDYTPAPYTYPTDTMGFCSPQFGHSVRPHDAEASSSRIVPSNFQGGQSTHGGAFSSYAVQSNFEGGNFTQGGAFSVFASPSTFQGGNFTQGGGFSAFASLSTFQGGNFTQGGENFTQGGASSSHTAVDTSNSDDDHSEAEQEYEPHHDPAVERGPRRNPHRNVQPPRCGTGGHLQGHFRR